MKSVHFNLRQSYDRISDIVLHWMLGFKSIFWYIFVCAYVGVIMMMAVGMFLFVASIIVCVHVWLVNYFSLT